MVSEMMTLTASTGGIILFIPAGNELNDQVRSAIPGARWNSTERHWQFPATRRVALALREFLRGKTSQLSIDPATGKQLASLADSAPTDDLVLERGIPVLRIERHEDYEAFVKRHFGKLQDDGSWAFEEDSAADLVADISKRNLDIKISADITRLAGKAYAPPPGYDGTLLSLTKIPVSVLTYAQKKQKTSTRKNPKAKKAPKDFLTKLSEVGITTLFDVINRLPLRYIDRSSPSRIADMVLGEQATLVGKILTISPYDQARRMTKLVFQDEDGKTMNVAFFNQRYINFSYRAGDRVILHGKYVVWTNKKGQKFRQLDSPSIDHLDSGRGSRKVIPIYPQSEKVGITTWDILSLTEELVARIAAPAIKETLPSELIAKYALMGKAEALKNIHLPSNLDEAKAARRRLVYEELLQLQLHIQARKAATQQLRGIEHKAGESNLVNQYLASLPYALTGAQERAKQAIMEDMSKPVPMHRLLQGDVGAGKSVCAAFTVLHAVESGYQAALMAPTEILAEQLYNGFVKEISAARLVSPHTGMPLRVEFLGGKTTKKNKERILADLASGDIDVIVGTHSLISTGVVFANLGVAIIDEQHRFGTEQRTILRSARPDGRTPDMLVMTATPIPRTGAMVLYGDLDITILDELPPGRIPITTFWEKVSGTDLVSAASHPVWDDVKQQVLQGHQAYVVASLVEDNEKLAAQSTEDALVALSNNALRGLRLGMVHGRQPRKEREEIMSQFAAGEIDVLVSTTVIEVGVNVPNATVMVVLDAGKFGIAQLHQIRGRVGRSSLPSRCYLISDTMTSDGIQRLNALVESTDGFYLAEKDLEIRGEGALFGQRQSGESDLRIASLKDMGALTAARADAESMIKGDPTLSQFSQLAAEVQEFFADKEIQS